MTVLAADKTVIRFGQQKHSSPNAMGVKAATKIYQGSLVVNDAGVAAPGRTALALKTLGVSKKQYDNTSGAANVIVGEYEEGDFLFVNDAGDLIAAADVGALCYITDDQTVCKTSATNTKSVAGRVKSINPTGYTGVVVEVGASIA